MHGNCRPCSPPLLLWEQIELSEAQVICLPMKRKCSYSLFLAPNFEEGLRAEMMFMRSALKCFIPSPALDDMWSHSNLFGLVSKVHVAGVLPSRANFRSGGRSGKSMPDSFSGCGCVRNVCKAAPRTFLLATETATAQQREAFVSWGTTAPARRYAAPDNPHRARPPR